MAETPMRFIRIDDETWAKAMARANREEATISELIRFWVQEYANEQLSITTELRYIIFRLNGIRERLKEE